MTLYYLAKRVRLDIVTSVLWRASRDLNPTEEDEKKLDRILEYLLHNIYQKVDIHFGDKVVLWVFVDASFGLYEEGRSVTGIVISLGSRKLWLGNQLSQSLEAYQIHCHEYCGHESALCLQGSTSALPSSTRTINDVLQVREVVILRSGIFFWHTTSKPNRSCWNTYLPQIWSPIS